MAKSTRQQEDETIYALRNHSAGIANFIKEDDNPNAYWYSQGIDTRSDAFMLTLLPATVKESGGVVTDLVKFADTTPFALNSYFVGDSGNFYQRTVQGSWSLVTTVPNSHGNGLGYFFGDDYVYVAGDSVLSRYGPTTLVNGSSQGQVTAPRGVNLSGLEFGNAIPGALNIDYFESSQNTFNYFAAKGLTTVRLPFLWERLQPIIGGSLDSGYKAYIDTQIGYAANAGMKVILDCHNYGRRVVYNNGGITELFTEAIPSLIYPYADYSQAGYIVLRDYGESLFGTLANPVSPATSYTITWTMQFNSRDTTFGGEGLIVKPFWQSDNSCYEFVILNDGTNTWTLNKVVASTRTQLKSGTFGFAWGTNVSHTFKIDVGQATSGKINISLDGTALYTTNSASTDAGLTGGQVAWYAQGVHVQLSDMILNVAGDTTSGGLETLRVGDPGLTTANFENFWTAVATAYADNETVLGYDLMNEPHDMPVPTSPSNYKVTAANTGLHSLTYRSIDAMKLTKDNITNQVPTAYITAYCNFLAAHFNLTHIGISIPLDTTAAFTANGSTPSPLTAEQYLAAWCTAIHNAGLKVLYRGTFCNMENIYNFPYLPYGNAGFVPQGTTSSAPTDGTTTWLGRVYSRIQTIGSNFESGDIFAPFPEQTSYVFNGNSFLSTAGSGIQANYYSFFEDLPTVITDAFTNLSISGVVTNLTSNNYSELRSGWLNSTFVTTVGAQAVDYYGNYNNDGYTPAQFGADLATIYSQNGNTAIFLQEFADIQNLDLDEADRITYLTEFYTELASLQSAGKLNGFNYWGGWDSSIGDGGEQILINSGTLENPVFGINYNGVVLQSFFQASGNIESTVTAMMQAAITGIRTEDSTHYIFAETDEWAGGQNFAQQYGSNPTPWLTDSDNKLVYSFHYYFDDDHSGTYPIAFASTNNTNIPGDVTPIMEWAQNNNQLLYAGEYGVPAIEDWQICLSTFLALANQYDVWATYWAAGDAYTSITTIQPGGSYPNYIDQLQMAIVGLPANLQNIVKGPQPQFTYDFLTASGGVPTNTYSLELLADASQYATADSSDSLKITSDLTLEAYVALLTLPAVGDSMSIVGKWDASGTTQSYLMDLYAISGFFGNGQDGELIVTSNVTQAPIDSACVGTAGAYVLNASNASFAPGQVIVIWQTQGTNAGQEERNVIAGYNGSQITLQTPLQGTYTTGAQVIVIPQYTSGTINATCTWSAKAWNGTTGGRLVGLFTSTFTNNGTVLGDGLGFRGGVTQGSYQGATGEGSVGASLQPPANQNYDAYTLDNPNGSGGGGGSTDVNQLYSGAGGGGNGTQGTNGLSINGGVNLAIGGLALGTADLTAMSPGGGGGGGSLVSASGTNTGGNGGACIDINAVTITGTGLFSSNGTNAITSTSAKNSGSGGGAGGSIRLKTQIATMTDLTCSAEGGEGSAGVGAGTNANGGSGGQGIIAISYLTSYADGTETPTPTYIQDNTLVTTATYQLRLHISSNGVLNEILAINLPGLSTGAWNRFSITWTASSSLANFYVNGGLIGSTVGSATAIDSNAGALFVGADNNASGDPENFLNGYINDVRIWAGAEDSQINSLYNVQLSGNQQNLAAYYTFNNTADDISANGNNLTLENSPLYSINVPFTGSLPLNIDQQYTTNGDTYAIPTTISESLANQLPFTPQFDPQLSMDVDVADPGTGDWTLTIHDESNNVIAQQTVKNSRLVSSGYQLFIWNTPWRIVIGNNYHAHLTSTVDDGTIVTSHSNALQSGGLVTADFHTYYQFLVTDTSYHPMARWLNFLVIGNERYLATWNGAFYQPNLIAFPAGTHVRCFGVWGAYLAIGTWQETNSGTPNIYDWAKGTIYFWDGISLTFNFSIDVPEGQVNAIYGMDADLYYIAGYKADLMYYHGSFANQSGSFNGTKVKRVPYLERSSYIETYPQAMAMWQGLLYFGMGGASDSVNFPRNVYSWGTLYPQYAQTLSSDYVISTGRNGSTVKIGLVYPVGKKLLIGWQDGLAYGVDVIDPDSGQFYQSGYLQTLIQDGGTVWHEDLLVKMRADHLVLNAGESVQIGAYLDRSSVLSLVNCATDTSSRFTVNTMEQGRVFEYQLQANLNGNGSSSPSVLDVTGGVNPLDSESQY